MKKTAFAFSIIFACSVFGQVTPCTADPSGVTDSTPAIAACLKALPAGDIGIPAGKYKIAGTLVKNRAQNLIGAGSKATFLECQLTIAACVVVADTAGGPNNYSDSRIQDLTIQGPGNNTASIGVFLGGDPAGVLSASNAFGDFASFVNTRITGFGHGIQWGNNAWLNKLSHTLVFGNGSGLYVPAGVTGSGENIGLSDSAVFNNAEYGIEDHGNFEWMLSGVSLDYNGYGAFAFYGAHIHALNCHFEQSAGSVFFQPYGTASLAIKDSEILLQATSGSDTYILSTWPQSLNVSIDNVSIWSNHPVQYFMRTQGTVNGNITDLFGNGNKMIQAMSNAASSVVVAASPAF